VALDRPDVVDPILSASGWSRFSGIPACGRRLCTFKRVKAFRTCWSTGSGEAGTGAAVGDADDGTAARAGPAPVIITTLLVVATTAQTPTNAMIRRMPFPPLAAERRLTHSW